MPFALQQYIKGQVTSEQKSILQEVLTEISSLKNSLELSLPGLDQRINVEQIRTDVKIIIFNMANNFIQNLEKEIEGIEGKIFRVIDNEYLKKIAVGIAPEIIKLYEDVDNVGDLPPIPQFMGTHIDTTDDNELDGIAMYLLPGGDKAQAKAKMLVGLNKEKEALEYLINTYEIDLNSELNYVLLMIDKIQHDTLTSADAQDRQLFLVGTRIPANEAERNANYPIRLDWLKAVAAPIVGELSRLLSLKRVRVATVNSINLLNNISSIISDIL